MTFTPCRTETTRYYLVTTAEMPQALAEVESRGERVYAIERTSPARWQIRTETTS